MVYLIGEQGTNFVKVGYSLLNPDSRRASMQTGNPRRLRVLGIWEAGTYEDEQALLLELDRFRAPGGTEWFEIPPEVLKTVLETGEFILPQSDIPEFADSGSRPGVLTRNWEEQENKTIPFMQAPRPGLLQTSRAGNCQNAPSTSGWPCMGKETEEHGIQDITLQAYGLSPPVATQRTDSGPD